jgi:hypothetical protein
LKNAPQEQRKLFSDVDDLRRLLGELLQRVASAGALESVSDLGQITETLTGFRTIMERFTEQLRPADGRWSKFSQRLTWTLWNKKETREYLDEFERMKSSLSLWLTVDIWCVLSSGLIKRCTTNLAAGMSAGNSRKTTRVSEHVQINVIVSHIRTAATREKIVEWMTPLNFLQRQADIFNSWQPGTGEWLLEDPTFQDWKSTSGKTFWCRGMCASSGRRLFTSTKSKQLAPARPFLRGSSIFTGSASANQPHRSLVVKYLETQVQNRHIGVACVYLNHKETEIQTPINIFASLWKQLSLGLKSIPDAVHLYQHHRQRHTRPSLDEVMKVLRSTLAEYVKVYVVVDALDEYPEDLRHLLLDHLAALSPTVNLMITSRPHINLEAAFPHILRLEIRATEGDIRRYVDTQIMRSPRLSKHARTRPELTNEIQSEIISNVQGMYVSASCTACAAMNLFAAGSCSPNCMSSLSLPRTR